MKYVEQFLPQALGLSAMSDLASTVALLVGALLTARALERDDAWAGAAAGHRRGARRGGEALGGAGPPRVRAGARRRTPLAGARGRRGRARDPACSCSRSGRPAGVGSLPLFERGEFQVAAGVDGVFAPVERYVDWSFGQLHRIERDFRGEFFSVRLLELTALGGAIALGRRTLAGAFLVGGWFAAIVLVKGGSSLASIDSGSFFRYVMPAFPAFCLLAASLLLLVPTLGGRLATQAATRLPSRRASIAIVSAGSAAFAVAAVVTLLATQLRGDIHVREGRRVAAAHPRRRRPRPDDQRRRPPDHAPLEPDRADERARPSTASSARRRTRSTRRRTPRARTRAAPSTARSSGRRPSARRASRSSRRRPRSRAAGSTASPSPGTGSTTRRRAIRS